MTTTDSRPRWPAELWAGARDAGTTVVPSVLAYAAVFGGLARQTGLSLGETVAMCLLVSAGTAQFVALPMLAAGAPAWLLVVTTYIVNLRHNLMAASLAPYFARLSRWRLALVAHGLSDEAYALTLARFARRPAHVAYFAAAPSPSSWPSTRAPSAARSSAAGSPTRSASGSTSSSPPSSSPSWRRCCARAGSGRSPAPPP